MKRSTIAYIGRAWIPPLRLTLLAATFRTTINRCARQGFDIGRSKEVADTLCDHFACSLDVQLAVPRLERRFVPCAAYFQRLLFSRVFVSETRACS